MSRPKLFDGLMRPKVLFDTNAVRYFFGRDGFTEEELARLRERVLRLAALDELRVVLTTVVGWELTKFYFLPDFGPAQYERMQRFIVAAGSQWALKHEHRRRRLELQKRRKLRDVEVFDACDVEVTVRMRCDPEEARRIFEMQKGLKDVEREKEARVRQAAVEGLAKNSPDWKASLDVDLSDGWDRMVKTFVKMEMRKVARREGLRLAGWQWPLPREVPTFWYAESFYAAKVRHVFVDSKKELTSKKSLEAMPDMLDSVHFRDAAYVDCLVTQDAVFRDVGAGARVPLLMTSFDEFARMVLA